MGRGCAHEAKLRHPRLPSELGQYILRHGNVPWNYGLTDDGDWLITFPVKHRWFEGADFNLIRESATTLTAIANNETWERVVMPRPGCGNGGLRWADVRRLLTPILDNRFHVITFA